MLKIRLSFMFVLIFSINLLSQNVRIKDVARFTTVRDNQLIGYGLVVGLKGTGDGSNSDFTIQSLAAMLDKMGIKVEKEKLKVKNVAAVMVTANYPPFTRKGTKLDVTVSSIGDASSLEGGVLLQTPLKGADGNVYAVAQGNIILGGSSTAGGRGTRGSSSFSTVGYIPNGSIVERELDFNLNAYDKLKLVLDNMDFASAVRVTKAINEEFGDKVAITSDARTIDITVPEYYLKNMAVSSFIASIEDLTFQPDNKAKVIINEKTGTIVSGKNVKLSEVALSHGDLKISITENEPTKVPQDTTKQNINIQNKQEKKFGSVIPFKGATTVEELADALNKLGVAPKDIISIFQALKQAGALHADLIIM